MPTFIITILISGASFPLIAFGLGIFNVIARIIYGIGYNSNGPKGRLIGALLGDLIILLLIGFSIASFFYTLK